MPEIHMVLCIRGYHIFGKTWTAALGEELCCECELSTIIDHYALAVRNSKETVGHLLKKISQMCNMSIQRGGKIIATVIGHRRYSCARWAENTM